MEQILHIKSTFDCLLKYSTTEKVLTKNKIFSFLLKDTTALSFYPISDGGLPFSCLISENDKGDLQTDRLNISLTKFPNNNYLMEVSPFEIQFSSFGLKTKGVNFGGTAHTISWLANSNLSVRIENSSTYLDFGFKCKVKELSTKSKGNDLVMSFKTHDEKFVVAHISYKNGEYTLEELNKVDILEENKNEITTYQNLHDFAGHGEIITFSFENDFEKTKTLAYDNDKPKFAKIKEFVPYAFFEAVKIKNFKLARIYLSQELSRKLTDGHIRKFFGDFVKVHQTLSQNYNAEEIALIYENNFEKTAKVFNIKLNENNLIENIIES